MKSLTALKMVFPLVLGVFSANCVQASEPSCFSTAAAAVTQTGVRGVQGFRLVRVQHDAFSGLDWATVTDCGHPEHPAAMLLVVAGTNVPKSLQSSRDSVVSALVMQAGMRVRLIVRDDLLRLEMTAVAQTSGAIGDRIRVRLLPVSVNLGEATSWSDSERFATGTVRSRDEVEMVIP